MDEADPIAQFLEVPVSEVLKHAGVSFGADKQPTIIAITATLDEAGKVAALIEPRPLPQWVIDRAYAAIRAHGDGSDKIVAAQIRALNGPLAFLDDALVLFKQSDNIETGAIGNLSICRAHTDELILAKIERARITGEARVLTIGGEVQELDLQAATPVLAILP